MRLPTAGRRRRRLLIAVVAVVAVIPVGVAAAIIHDWAPREAVAAPDGSFTSSLPSGWFATESEPDLTYWYRRVPFAPRIDVGIASTCADSVPAIGHRQVKLAGQTLTAAVTSPGGYVDDGIAEQVEYLCVTHSGREYQLSVAATPDQFGAREQDFESFLAAWEWRR